MARNGIRNVLGRCARLSVVATGFLAAAAPVGVPAQPITGELHTESKINLRLHRAPGGA